MSDLDHRWIINEDRPGIYTFWSVDDDGSRTSRKLIHDSYIGLLLLRLRYTTPEKHAQQYPTSPLAKGSRN